MATNKKITQLDELTPATWADDDVIAIVDISAQETKKIQLSTFRGAVTGVSTLNASTPLTVDSATGDVTISVAINGGGTINAVFDEDDMTSNSPTALATQQSIKAYVDSQIITVDSLSEVLALGNTTGGTDLSVSTGDDITFADSSKAIFGAGSDLQIYHDASNSIIKDAGTGILYIAATTLNVTNAAISETAATFSTAGASTLYFANASKFATTATGVDVTGTIVGDGLTLTTGATVTTVLDEDNMASNSATALSTQQSIKAYVDAQVGTADTLSEVLALGNTTGGTDIAMTGGDKITNFESTGINDDAASTTITINSYDNVGIGNGVDIQSHFAIGTGAEQFEVNVGSGFARIQIYDRTAGAYDNFQVDALTHVFRTGQTERVRIDSSGNFGIGTSSVATNLHVYENTANGTINNIALLDAGNQNPSVSGSGVSLDFRSNSGASYFGGVGGYSDGTNYVAGLWGGAAASGAPDLVVTSSGNVGIGTSSPSSKLDITGSGAYSNRVIHVAGDINPTGYDSGTSGARIGFTYGATPVEVGGIRSGVTNGGAGSETANLVFSTANSGTLSEKMRITSSGNVGIGTASPAVPLDVVGNIRSSTGILFGTDTAAANLLDDYEEGDWTPTIGSAATVSPDATYNAGFTAGKYTKVGRVVHCSATLRLTDKGTQSGSVTILGLPFASANNVGSRSTWSCWFHGATDIDLTGNVSGTIMVFQTNNVSYVQFRVLDPSNGTAENVEFADISDTVYVQISGSYVAA